MRYALRGVRNLYHIATQSVISLLRSKYIALRSNISLKFQFSEHFDYRTVQRLPLTRELSAKLTEGEKIKLHQYIFLSLRRKSKIFATSLIRGRLWCGASTKQLDKLEFEDVTRCQRLPADLMTEIKMSPATTRSSGAKPSSKLSEYSTWALGGNSSSPSQTSTCIR